jgi:protein PsiE
VLIALAVLVIRYGHVRYPYLEDLEDLAGSSSKKNNISD